MGGKTIASIKVTPGATLDILVENMGRINYGPHLQDPKGIVGDVTLGKVVLSNWMMYPLDLDPVVLGLREPLRNYVNNEENNQIPTFYTGDIPPTPDGTPRDTFLKLPGWFKVRKCLKRLQVGQQGWRSGESTRLSPMWPGWCHVG